ncbi:glycosyl transferase family 2 [Paenibacillus albidus]|uniref:Glycosyl transferase family 2 n=1 Tax=Paenibacillus albidus TaxID=2041023 RepID=A0A917BV54_9BACL|nr:glycosyltransferase [Paenibacillus albidus]GGF59806.1 glycosyl transferase family 2 [Paenibacillus albidus]
MNKEPKVSIVIPFYNCPYVDRAVQSALDQTYPCLEIIVVDDGSTREKEKLESFKEKIIYIPKSNGGTASALNRGIERASGTYFAWLSADDLFHPHKIARQMERLQHTGTLFNHTGYYYINELGTRISEPVRMPIYNKGELVETMMTGCPVNGSSVLLHMDIFRKVGLFNESFLYTQDYDLWLRILPHYEWSYIEEPLLDYRVHKEMGSVVHKEAQTQEIKGVQAKHREILSRLLRKERGG